MTPVGANYNTPQLSGEAANLDQIVVAYVVHNFATGGLERIAAWLANRLDRRRFRPVVISLTEATAAHWLNQDVPVISLHKPAGNSFAVVRQLAAALSKHQVDIIHSHSWSTLVESVLARRIARVPWHLHAEHGTLPDTACSAAWRRARGGIMWCGLRQTNNVVAVAESIRRRVTAFSGFPLAKIKVIPNGVEIPAQPSSSVQIARQTLRSSLGIADDAVVFGSVGRLSPVKGYDMLISAFERTAFESPHIHLVLVGDGPDQERLKEQSLNAKSRSRIHLVGYQSAPCDWLRAMDVYVNSSHSEGMSLAVLEAMGVGLPIIATSVGDHETLITATPACGVILPAGDGTALACAIRSLANDRDQREELGRWAQIRQQSGYSLASMTRAYELAYADIAGLRRDRSWLPIEDQRPLQC